MCLNTEWLSKGIVRLNSDASNRLTIFLWWPSQSSSRFVWFSTCNQNLIAENHHTIDLRLVSKWDARSVSGSVMDAE